MVQSPFRYKKPKSTNSRLSFFSSSSESSNERQTPAVWIGGDTFVGEGRASSLAEALRGMFSRGNSSASMENDLEQARENGNELETESSTASLDDDARIGLSTANDRDENDRKSGNRKTQIIPQKDTDVLLGSFHNSRRTPFADMTPVPPPEFQSVSIGGRIIIGQRLVPSNRTNEETMESCKSHAEVDEDPSDGDEGEYLTADNDKQMVKSGPNGNSSLMRHATPPRETRVGLSLDEHCTIGSRGIRRRLSKRARTRLTMREVNSEIQPGRNCTSMESMGHLEMAKAITLPKTIDFFRRIEIKIIILNVCISTALTALALHACPLPWQDRLRESSASVSVLGAFLSFALVFRTQACYARWWEARTMWGRMSSASINLAGKARGWFGDEDADRFLTHCVAFPYACKATLRGNPLTDASEEGPRFLRDGLLTEAELGAIARHGRPPFFCLEVLRRTACGALHGGGARGLHPATLGGAYLAMEQVLWELSLNIGACLKINSTRMPASYTVFMRSFVVFFFVLASLSWAPSMRWLTPVVTGFMVFSINTVIVIGDQMMRPFDLQWAGLPLQKFCVAIEHEIMNVSRRHADINTLLLAA